MRLEVEGVLGFGGLVGFRVLGFWVCGLLGLAFSAQVSEFGLRVEGFGSRVSGFWV